MGSAMRRKVLILLAVWSLFLGAWAAAWATPGQILLVQDETARLRQRPDPQAQVVRDLAVGDKLIEFRREDGWVKVGVFGTLGVEGWLRAGAVEKAVFSTAREPSTPPLTPPDLPLLLEVEGTPALEFKGRCTLIEADGRSHRLPFRGSVPRRFALEAEAASCKVEKTDAFGRLIVSLSLGSELLARQETRAAFNYVRVRSDGPWGEARGLRGRVGLLLTKPPPPRPGIRATRLPPR
jgi:hypothetical protein